jgi:hypothetical protein
VQLLGGGDGDQRVAGLQRSPNRPPGVPASSIEPMFARFRNQGARKTPASSDEEPTWRAQPSTTDRDHLPNDDWDLADTFARLHSIATGDSTGVVRGTVAYLMLALDVCELVHDREETPSSSIVIARIRAALGVDGARAH